MKWNKVGEWITTNAGKGTQLIGNLVSGNIPGAIATGVSLITGATGTNNPDEALEVLKNDPQAVLRLKELYYQNETEVRNHLKDMTELEYANDQQMHTETQTTIRAGDVALDQEIRRTRPTMAKQSWTATVAYSIGSFGVRAITAVDLFEIEIAMILSAPAWAYLGLRTTDKIATAWKDKVQTKV